MKRLILCTILFAAMFSQFLLIRAQPEAVPAIRVQKVSERVIALNLVDNPGGNSIVAINSKKGIVVIDTEASPSLAQWVRQRIEQEFGRKDFLYVINSHDHGDHTWGNQVFPDCAIIGHENIAEQMSQFNNEAEAKKTVSQIEAALPRMRDRQKKLEKGSEAEKAQIRKIAFYETLAEGLRHFVMTPPSLAFNDRMSVRLDDLTLELKYFGPCHSQSDITIFCPQEGLLLTGDLFVPGLNLSLNSERVPELPRWIDNLEQIVARKQDIRTIVSGHGDFIPIADLESKLNHLKTQMQQVSGRKSAFSVFQQTQAEKGLPMAIGKYRELKARQSNEYYFFESELIGLGYAFLRQDKTADAIAVFQLAAESFPDSFNAFDSLAEAYMNHGDKQLAIKNYKRSLELNPENDNAREMIKKLEENAGVKEP